MQARWMMPELGRFLSSDPARDGLNWYIYCSNNPTTNIDPDGLNDINSGGYITQGTEYGGGNYNNNFYGYGSYFGYTPNTQPKITTVDASSWGSTQFNSTANSSKPFSFNFLKSGIQNRSIKDLGLYVGYKFAEMLSANHQSWAQGNVLSRIGDGLLTRHAQDINLASNIFLSTNPFTSSFMANKNAADFGFNLASQAKFAYDSPYEFIDSQVTGVMKTAHQEASFYSQGITPGVPMLQITDAYTPEETGALIYEKGQEFEGLALSLAGEYAIPKIASIGSKIGLLDDILFKGNYVDDVTGMIKPSSGPLKNLSGSIDESAYLARTQPYGNIMSNPIDEVASSNFATQEKFTQHFIKHGKEFGNITESQYLSRAQKLVNSSQGGNILTKVRSNGDVLFYNKATNEFAVKSSKGIIRTLFKPKNGLDYFLKQ